MWTFLKHASARRRPHRRLSVEALEDRWLPSTFIVLNANDAGPGSLRQAILDADAGRCPAVIDFAIPGPGVHTIAPTSALPDITVPVTIDGYSQPGASPNTLTVGDNAVLLIQLDGSNAGLGANGLHITAGGSSVKGLDITNFMRTDAPYQGGVGILMDTNGDNVIQGNFIGTDPTGSAAAGNTQGVDSFHGAYHNLIGGPTPADRNIISGNVDGILAYTAPPTPSLGDMIQGNYVGLNAAGTAALANTEDGVDVGVYATVGGLVPGTGNVISGNHRGGVTLLFDHHFVQGNFIGTDATGTYAIANNWGIACGGNDLIGGTMPGAGNVISGNASFGLGLSGNDVVQGNRIGVDAAAIKAVPNFGDGVLVQATSNNTIGGNVPGAGNVISANGHNGVYIIAFHNPATNNLVEGNLIGTDGSGFHALGNQQDGVRVGEPGYPAPNNQIGGPPTGDPSTFANTIAFNGGAGVALRDATTMDNPIRGNQIFGNTGLGIDLTGSGVITQPPVLLAADSNLSSTDVSGTFSGVPGATYVLDFYAGPQGGPGPAKSYLGSATVVTDPITGLAQFALSLAGNAGAQMITATATDVAGNTSQFAGAAYVVPPAILILDIAGAISYTAGPGAANNLTISQNGADYVFNDTGEWIQGFAVTLLGLLPLPGNGTHTVTCLPITTAIRSITVDSGDQQDTVNVQSIGVPTTITDSGGGDDTINVGAPINPFVDLGSTVEGITASLTVNDPSSRFTLNVNDTGDTGPAIILAAVGPDAVSDLAPAPISFQQSNLAALNIWLGSGPNRITVNDTPDNSAHPVTTINVGIGTHLATVQNTTGPLVLAGTPALPVVLVTIGIQGTVQGIHGDVTITNPGASVTVDDRADTTRHDGIIIREDGIAMLAPAAINYPHGRFDHLEDLSILGGGGGNTFTITGTPGSTTIVPGLDGDTVNVQATSAPLTVNAGIAVTHINFGNAGSVQDIYSDIYIQGGLVDIRVDDSNDPQARSATVGVGPVGLGPNFMNIVGLAPSAIHLPTVSLFSLEIDGGRGGNTFDIGATGQYRSLMLKSGRGDDTVQVETNSNLLFINGQGGRDSVSILRLGVATSGGGSDFTTLKPITVSNVADDGSRGATALFVDDVVPGVLRLQSDSVGLQLGADFVAGVYWEPMNSGIASLSVLAPGSRNYSGEAQIQVDNSPSFPTDIRQKTSYTYARVRATTGPLSIEAEDTTLGAFLVGDAGTFANFNADFHAIDVTASGSVQSHAAGGQFDGNAELCPFDAAYDGQILEFTSGAYRGQKFVVSGYVGVSRTFSLDPIQPNVGDTFLIYVDDSKYLSPSDRRLTLNDRGDPVGRSVIIGPNTVTGLAVHAALTYETDLSIASPNRLPVYIYGGTGNNLLQGPNGLINEWVIDGQNTGSLDEDTIFYSFQALLGSNANDYFTLMNGGSISGVIDGGGGSNKLIGPDTANAWLIDRANGGTVNSATAYRSIQNLTGGTADDTFVFKNGGSVGGTLDGGGGTNTLRYNQYTGDITVDLALNLASLVDGGAPGSLFHVANVVGSIGNSLIVGDASANVLNGGTGRNIIIGGLGSDLITGGGGDNILIGGYSVNDQNLTALNAIFAEWTSADSLSTRKNDILNGGGLNGHFLLTPIANANHPATVFDDGVVDQLFDGAGLSWFFWNPRNDSINNGSGPLVNGDLVSVIH
jgi:hypothetical protein